MGNWVTPQSGRLNSLGFVRNCALARCQRVCRRLVFPLIGEDRKLPTVGAGWTECVHGRRENNPISSLGHIPGPPSCRLGSILEQLFPKRAWSRPTTTPIALTRRNKGGPRYEFSINLRLHEKSACSFRPLS